MSSALYHMTFLVLLHGLGLASKCDLQPGAVEWNPHPSDTVINITWGYGDNYTCHTNSNCFPPGDSSKTLLTPFNQSVPVQLYPVELQDGNILKFFPSHHMGILFSISPWRVDEAGFISCNTSGGVQVSELTNDTIEVPQDLLKPGDNYFIADPVPHPLVSCEMGLRVKVTVKVSVCQGHEALCNGRGHCISYPYQPTFGCECCGNYKGAGCEVFDPCLSSPCLNEGACLAQANSTHGYTCHCPFGYRGPLCEIQVEDQCQLVDCGRNGSCVGNKTSFRCICPPGMTGSHCEVDINDCKSSPCVSGTCVDKLNGFRCICNPGYHGEKCTDRHPACSLNPCKNGGYCHDTQELSPTFKCHCTPGWAGPVCDNKLSPCSPGPCTVNGHCSEAKNGSALCRCYPGFTGTRCEVNINECEPNPCQFGGHCRDGVNAHTCLCIHSHGGSNCQLTLDSTPGGPADNDQQVPHKDDHGPDMYIVAGCLTTLVFLLLVLLVACYCKLGSVCRRCWVECNGRSRFWYKRQTNDDLRVCVDSTSLDCPLSNDVIWRNRGGNGDNGHDNSRTRIANQSV